MTKKSKPPPRNNDEASYGDGWDLDLEKLRKVGERLKKRKKLKAKLQRRHGRGSK